MSTNAPRWPYPRVLAHRGGGSLAPENTLAAIRVGQARGFKGVEFDVMLAADAVPVLMHDPKFGRTVAGDGAVAGTASTQLAAMDAGGWYSACYIGEPVPLFADVLHYCQDHDIWMNIEIKPSDESVALATGRAVAAAVRLAFAHRIARSTGGLDPALPEFSSFSMAALMGAREIAPEIPRGLLVTDIPNDWRERVRATGALALHPRERELTAERVAEVHAEGMALMCYTVNEVQRARELFDWGVDAFCTDRLDLIAPDFT